MGAAPLSWLAKIGGDTLKTKAKLLSSAINELYDDGQCKIVAVVDNTADNGKTVLITTDDNKTYSGTIANKKCEFLLPPKTLYTVQKVSSGSAEFTTKVEAGYGDCILVHLDTGYVDVKQGDIVGLDYIKAATDDNLKNKVPEAKAVKELNSSLGGLSFGKDGEGNYGYFGADGSLIPFNRVSTGTFTISSSGSTVQLGFKPKTVFVFNFSSTGQPLKMAYHSDDITLKGFYDVTSQGGYITSERAITPIDNGFKMTQFSDWVTGTCYYYAW